MRLPMPWPVRFLSLWSSLALLCLAFVTPSGAAVVLNRQNAVNAVTTELGLGGITQAWSPYADYGSGPGFEGVLPTGTNIRPYRLNTLPFPGNVVTLTNPMYLFFVDEEPQAGFSHEVSYVYVDATVSNPTIAAGTITIQTQGWWPVIQRPSFPEEEIFGAFTRFSPLPGGFNNPFGLVFGAAGPPKPAGPPPLESFDFGPELRAGGMNNCAIVATGTAGGAAGTADNGHEGSADAMKMNLTNRGVPAGRIQDKRNANKADLKAAVAALCAASPACDKIYVFLASHGSNGSIELGSDGTVTKDSLCAILKPLGAKGAPVCLMIHACYSGSLVPALRPKFPTGVIVTTSDSTHESWCDTVEDSMGVSQGDQGFFAWAFFKCWNSAAADSNGDGTVDWAEAFRWTCHGNNAKVRWNGSYWDTKTQGPTLNGLAPKSSMWKGPISGAWYTENWKDTDRNGMYDQCDWSRDDDCDGNKDVEYQNTDKDADGHNEKTVGYRDANDDGQPETRYDFVDSNDDGNTDMITCYNWSGSNWVQTAQAPRRSGTFSITPPTGSKAGDRSFQILGSGGTSWFNPVQVFFGSDCKNVILQNPTTITGVTKGFFVGPRNAIVVDFLPSSLSYGFVEMPNAYTYTPEIFVDSVDPSFGPCYTPVTVTIRGSLFSSMAQVLVDGSPVPSLWLTPSMMTAQIPAIYCDEPLDIKVDNPGLGEATLLDGFTSLPAVDTTLPVIQCQDITLPVDPDGLGRTPPSFGATATDDGPPPTVVRNALGSLPPGMNSILFEAIDAAANRALCTANVNVSDQGDVNGPGIPDRFQLVGNFPNPFPAATRLRIGLPREGPVRLSIFDLSGRLIAVPLDGVLPAGYHEVPWDGLDSAGQAVPSGIYFVKMAAGGSEEFRRISIVR